MVQNEKALADLSQPESVATCYFKNNLFWMFHKNQIEDSEQEKASPGDKLWLVMRHMAADPDHEFQPNLGFKLGIGNTDEFGRVRY